MNSDFSNIALEEQELITEWTIDPKKKSKLIDIALHKFRSECKKSKNAYIKNRVYIMCYQADYSLLPDSTDGL